MIVAIQGAINNELAMNNATVQLSAILKLLSTEYILDKLALRYSLALIYFTLAKTEIICPKNVGTPVAMNFT